MNGIVLHLICEPRVDQKENNISRNYVHLCGITDKTMRLYTSSTSHCTVEFSINGGYLYI